MPNQKPSCIGQDRRGYAVAYRHKFSSHLNYTWVSWGPAPCLLNLGPRLTEQPTSQTLQVHVAEKELTCC